MFSQCKGGVSQSDKGIEWWLTYLPGYAKALLKSLLGLRTAPQCSGDPAEPIESAYS